MAKFDAIIKNGTVFDGKGNDRKNTDIGIKDDKVKKIGDLQKYDADIVIDAKGQYVCPGFIDLTTHSDTHWSLFAHPNQENFIRQGVTTILGGNCGLSLAPITNREGIEGMEKWVNISTININWRTMEEFFNEIEKHKLPLNFCTLVGVNTLHKAVMGNKTEEPNDNEIEQIKNLLDKSLKEGAFGISTSFGSVYNQVFSEKEIFEILKITKKNNGLSKHHLEDEGLAILPSLSKLISFARESKVKLHISHLKALGKTSWQYFENIFLIAKNAREEGIEITYDFFPYTKTGSNLFMLLPQWLRKKSPTDVLEIIRAKDSKERNDVLYSLKNMTLHYDKITIASTFNKLENIGKTITQLSELSGITCEEIILDLLSINNLQVSIFSEIISEENIDVIAKDKYSAIASDGVGYDMKSRNDLPHPRSFGTFPKSLNVFVKEKDILTWEQVVNKMTGLPATILNLKERGAIEEGHYADITIFDPETIKDRSDYYNPFQFPEGIKYVFVNGKIVLDNNSLTGNLSGKLLRKK